MFKINKLKEDLNVTRKDLNSTRTALLALRTQVECALQGHKFIPSRRMEEGYGTPSVKFECSECGIYYWRAVKDFTAAEKKSVDAIFSR